MDKLRIGLDIDDTLVDFMGSYLEKFGQPKYNHVITRNVYKLRHNKEFWTNLPKLNDIDFIPELYCTKRINSKSYTKESLEKQGFPKRPIYQVLYQRGRKSQMVKGKIDIFIDDSISNFNELINSGVPCLLIDAPHNRNFDTPYRIYDLQYETILNKYNEFTKSIN